MAVIKLTSSKKALLFIDDSGNSFITSLSAVMKCINDSNPNTFVLLTRFPNPVASDRFPSSPVYNAEKVVSSDNVTTTNDVFSKRAVKDKPIDDVIMR